MSLEGRTAPFRGETGKVRNRREAVAAVRSSGGPLTDLTPAARPLGREPLKMPHLGHSRTAGELAQPGGIWTYRCERRCRQRACPLPTNPLCKQPRSGSLTLTAPLAVVTVDLLLSPKKSKKIYLSVSAGLVNT